MNQLQKIYECAFKEKVLQLSCKENHYFRARQSVRCYDQIAT